MKSRDLCQYHMTCGHTHFAHDDVWSDQTGALTPDDAGIGREKLISGLGKFRPWKRKKVVT